GPLDGLRELELNATVNLLALGGGEIQALGESIDGIALRPLLPLGLGLIVAGIASRVPCSPVRQELEQYGPSSAAALLDGPPASSKDSQHVVAIHRLTPKSITGCPVGYPGILHDEVDAGRCAVEVVLTYEDHGQIPDGRHIDAFVKRAFSNGTVTEEAGDHLVLVAHLERERHSRSERDSAGHDGDARNHALGHVAHVHRAATTLAASALRAKQLIEELLGRQTLGERMTVAAKCRGDPVLGSKRGADPHRRGLLPLALVNGPRHRSLEEEEFHGVFEFT